VSRVALAPVLCSGLVHASWNFVRFAAPVGARLLREGDLARRAMAAMGMVPGIWGLALG
jgi:hypothetical protein